MTTNYSTFQNQLLTQVAAYSSDINWATELPLVIDRAEQRCYRDLDMFGVRLWAFINAGMQPFDRLQVIPPTSGITISFGSPSLATVAFGVQPPISIDQINVLTNLGAPSSIASSSGSRTVLVRQSPVFIDLCWPSDATAPGTPQYWAPISDQSFLVGPAPNAAFAWEFRAPFRPLALSSANSSTPLTINYPDVFFAAAMIEAGMFMRFVEPQMSATWLTEYKDIMKSATVEEMRKRNAAEGWLSYQPSPVATPPRM